MFQSEEMVNQVLDYSKILVDQVEREKGVHYSLKEKSKQYLIFAGMLSYYGLDNVTVIYEAFKLMNFHISNLSVEEIIEKNYHLNILCVLPHFLRFGPEYPPSRPNHYAIYMHDQ